MPPARCNKCKEGNVGNFAPWEPPGQHQPGRIQLIWGQHVGSECCPHIVPFIVHQAKPWPAVGHAISWVQLDRDDVQVGRKLYPCSFVHRCYIFDAALTLAKRPKDFMDPGQQSEQRPKKVGPLSIQILIFGSRAH